MTAADPTVIIAVCGNADAGDDAFGPMVARQLGGPPRGAKIVHVHTDATALLDHLPDAAALIVVDAVNGPGLPRGELVDLDWRSQARPRLASESPASSTHGISIAAAIDLADRLQMLPQRARLIGMAIDDVSLGAEVDLVMRDSVRLACARIKAHVCKALDARGMAHA